MTTPFNTKKRMPYIKICGFLDPMDARAAARFGADLIGLNFYSGSPRAVSFGLARKIQEVVHAASAELKRKRPVRTVAVMVDPEPEFVLELMQEVQPDILQFHGNEPPHVCQYFKVPFMKAFRLRGAGDVALIPKYLGGYCVGYLIDSYSESDFGGTGRMLSPTLAREGLQHPRGFLAGGLNCNNIEELVRDLQPYGVDVASGIELRPGIKSHELMAEFIRKVREGVKAQP